MPAEKYAALVQRAKYFGVDDERWMNENTVPEGAEDVEQTENPVNNTAMREEVQLQLSHIQDTASAVLGEWERHLGTRSASETTPPTSVSEPTSDDAHVFVPRRGKYQPPPVECQFAGVVVACCSIALYMWSASLVSVFFEDRLEAGCYQTTAAACQSWFDDKHTTCLNWGSRHPHVSVLLERTCDEICKKVQLNSSHGAEIDFLFGNDFDCLEVRRFSTFLRL